MWPLIMGAVSAIGSAFYLWADWRTSQDIAESTSQMQHYIDLINGVMGPEEFVAEAWPSFVMIFLILVAGYIIATPGRRRRRDAR